MQLSIFSSWLFWHIFASIYFDSNKITPRIIYSYTLVLRWVVAGVTSKHVIHALPHRRLSLVFISVVERVYRTCASSHAIAIPCRRYVMSEMCTKIRHSIVMSLPTMTGALGFQLASRTQVLQPPGSSKYKRVRRSRRRVPLVASLTSMMRAMVASML